MSDLETAAHDALAQVQPLTQALADAQRECQEAVRYLHALGERLSADRRALQDLVAALRKDADDTGQLLSSQAADAAANLGRVAQAVTGAVDDWGDVFHSEDAALAGGSSLLAELGSRVKELADSADQASHAALEWAGSTSQQLEQAVEAVEQVVSVGLTTLIADWRRQIEVSVTRLVDYFEKDCEGLLNARETDWKAKVAELHALLDHGFAAIAPHQGEIAAYTVERWEQLMQAQLTSTRKEAQSLNEALASLRQAAANYEGSLQVAAGMIAEHQQHGAQSAARLEQALLEARGRWATFGIGS